MSATQSIYLGCIALVGIVNALPVVGALGASQLASAYGIALPSDSIVLLLRHRAILFGIMGAFVLVSLARPEYRIAAFVMAGTSMLSFLVLAGHSGVVNESIRKIVTVDVIGLTALAVAVVLHRYR
ncbi:MAG: phosphopantetheine adenylyltransferase [Pseudomonadota bacterium]